MVNNFAIEYFKKEHYSNILMLILSPLALANYFQIIKN